MACLAFGLILWAVLWHITYNTSVRMNNAFALPIMLVISGLICYGIYDAIQWLARMQGVV